MTDKQVTMDELTDAWREQIELGKQLARTVDQAEREKLKRQLDEVKRRFDEMTERYYSREREAREAKLRETDEERRKRMAAEVEARLKAEAFAASGLDELAFERIWRERLRDEMLARHTLQTMTDAQRALRDQLRQWIAG